MTTARVIINKSARLIGVKRANIDLSSDELNEGLETLQDWLVERQAAGVKFPVNYPVSVDDDLDEPDWTRSYIKTQLAERLAMEYTVPISQELMMMIKTAKDAVYQFLFSDMTVAYPDTLPIGEGNREYGDWFDNFYPDVYDDTSKNAAGDLLTDGEGNQIYFDE